MRLHFSIGCYDCRKTPRNHQSFQLGRFQILSAYHVHRRLGVYRKTLSSGLILNGEEKCHCIPPLTSIFSLPLSTLLRNPNDLATLSPPETDPQILERWGYADEVHLGKYIRAKDFGLEFWCEAQ